jgi:predicted aspartyl protease
MVLMGREFPINYDGSFPSLEIDISIFSPVLTDTPTFYKLKNVVIDTGSDFTLIPNSVIFELGLKYTGQQVELEGYNGESEKINFYAGKVLIEGILEEIIMIGGINSDPLIGMDLISKCDILINFSKNTFEIAKASKTI